MTHTDIIKSIMYYRRMTQTELAERAGLSGQGRVSDRLNRKNCTVKGLAELLKGLNCELIIREEDGLEYVIKADDYE